MKMKRFGTSSKMRARTGRRSVPTRRRKSSRERLSSSRTSFTTATAAASSMYSGCACEYTSTTSSTGFSRLSDPSAIHWIKLLVLPTPKPVNRCNIASSDHFATDQSFRLEHSLSPGTFVYQSDTFYHLLVEQWVHEEQPPLQNQNEATCQPLYQNVNDAH